MEKEKKKPLAFLEIIFCLSVVLFISSTPPEHALMWSGCSSPPPCTVHTAAPSSESGHRVGLSCSGTGADSGADSREFPLQQ